MAESIFRKVALERLSSPEQLDKLVRITDPKGWIAIIGIGCLIAGAVLWGFLGSIPVRVTGEGMLVKSGGVYSVVAGTSGRVTDIFYEPGDTVARGAIVARVNQTDLKEKIRITKVQLNNLRERYALQKKLGAQTLSLTIRSLNQKRDNIRTAIKILKDKIPWLTEKVRNEEILFRKGLITKQQVLQAKQELENVKQQILNYKQQLKQLAAEKVQQKSKYKDELNSLEIQIKNTEQTLKTLKENLHKSSKIVSFYSGRVLEIDINPGEIVSPGSVVMRLELVDKRVEKLVGVLYAPASSGKRVQPGMKAKISPSTAHQEEYGLMLGMVTYVSEFPVSQAEIMKEMQNESLVRALMTEGPPIEIHIALIPDPRTPSGFKWTSSRGPSFKIGPGTLCGAMIDIKEKRPIDFVIPLFKKYILGVGETKP